MNKATRKKFGQLRQEIIALKELDSKQNSLMQSRLGDLSREILDITHPPKKGYTRFKTIDGWASFKLRKKPKEAKKK